MGLAVFSNELARRGCVSDGKIYCGTYEGLPFAACFISGRDGGATAFGLGLLLNRKVPGRLYWTVRKQMRGYAEVGRATNAHAGLFFVGGAFGSALAGRRTPATLLNLRVLIRDEAAFGSTFDALMRVVAGAVRKEGYTPPDTCPVCRRPACDSYAHVNGAYRPVHAGCVQADSYQKQVEVQENEARGSVGLGVLGACLGALVGMVPSILAMVFLDVIAGFLCALIPYCAYRGYKLLGGRMGKAVRPIVIVLSILAAPVMLYLTTAVFLFLEYGFIVGPLNYFLTFMETPADFLTGLGQITLFIGIGILIVLGSISRNNSHTWNEAGFSAATLRPINPPAGAPWASAAAPAAPADAPQAPSC